MSDFLRFCLGWDVSIPASSSTKPRRNTDQNYVIDICDSVLGEAAMREYNKFDWLRGDKGHPLPVDAYWPDHGLVVEYQERQHFEPVDIFDKPGVLTVSGIPRSEQRALYDRRREELIPANGLALAVIRHTELAANQHGRLLRDVLNDTPVITRVLSPYLSTAP